MPSFRKIRLRVRLLSVLISIIDHVILRRELSKRYVFWGNQATALKRRLLREFIRTGTTFKIEKTSATFASRRESNVWKGRCDTAPYLTQSISPIISELNKSGFYVLDNFVPIDVCQRIVSFAESTPCFPRPRDHHQTIEPVESILSCENILSARYDFSPKPLSIFQNMDLQNFISNPFLYSIAQKYLGSDPLLDPVELWWLFPFPVRDSAWAEEYHFDFDSVKWLKFFFNFEDVSIENGPHCFISGTHRDAAIPDQIRMRGYVRHSDDDLFKLYSRDRERRFTLKAGSLLIEDSRGFHKGLVPVSGRRLLFQFQLSSHLFIDESAMKRRFLPNFPMSSSFSKLLESKPGYFSRYIRDGLEAKNN